MGDYDITASVDPSIRQVTEGEDATFSCNVSGDDVGTVDIAFNWVAHHSVISELRFQTNNEGQGFRILRTTAAENNSDVTCSVRSFETKELLTSGKSRLIVMPVEIVQPITSPPHLTATKSTGKHTRTSTARPTPTTGPTPTTAGPPPTLPRHETQTLTEVIGKTAQTGPQGGLNVAILAGATVGAIALSLIILVVLLTLLRSKKRRKLTQRASFSGSHAGRNADGALQMKRYKFVDYKSGQQMAFSETDSPAPKSPQKHEKGRNGDGEPQLKQYEFLDSKSGQQIVFSETDSPVPKSPQKHEKGRNGDGKPHPQLKRYEFLDSKSGQQIAFSETDRSVPEKGSNQANQGIPPICSRRSTPDIVASCNVENDTSENLSDDSENQTENSLFLTDIHENSCTMESKC